MSKAVTRSSFGPALLVGGGVLTVSVGVWLATRKSAATVLDIEKAIKGTDDPDPDTGKKGSVDLRLTGYWPYAATASEQKMEGGLKDRRGNTLYTLEQHLSDSSKYPYVSCAGDDSIWPYGQRIGIDVWPNAVFRIVDTGGHFRGAGKLYRVLGHEPIDVCVDSSKTTVPKTAVGQVFVGDNFEKGKAVATAGLKGQNVVLGDDDDKMTLPSDDDREALARAIESELGGRPLEEQHAAAWALRNRANGDGVTVHQLLAPNGTYGSPQSSYGFASTRKTPTDQARTIANSVLEAAPSLDPTDGAIDFWIPEQQQRMQQLGDVYRAALKNGDETKARAYERYADYGSEGDVRVSYARDGIRPIGSVGVIELLGRG